MLSAIVPGWLKPSGAVCIVTFNVTVASGLSSHVATLICRSAVTAASNVMVSYDNLVFTRLAVECVLANTDFPDSSWPVTTRRTPMRSVNHRDV